MVWPLQRILPVGIIKIPCLSILTKGSKKNAYSMMIVIELVKTAHSIQLN